MALALVGDDDDEREKSALFRTEPEADPWLRIKIEYDVKEEDVD